MLLKYLFCNKNFAAAGGEPLARRRQNSRKKGGAAAQPLLSARSNIFCSLGGELHGFSAQNLKNM
jgi:hypothetical protein